MFKIETSVCVVDIKINLLFSPILSSSFDNARVNSQKEYLKARDRIDLRQIQLKGKSLRRNNPIVNLIMEGFMKSIIIFFIIFLSAFKLHATVWWDDEMESGNTGYSLPGGGAMTFDTSVKFSGNGSLRLNYTSDCYPDRLLEGYQCGGYTDRVFPATSNLYRRYYINLASNFTTGDSGTKIMGSFPPGDFTFSVWMVFQFGSHALSGVTSRNLDGVAEVYRENGTVPFGKWVCIETHEKLNTPGVADGIYEMWVDGVQVTSVKNAMYLVKSDNNKLGINRLYRQVGLGNLWFDRIAVGDSRIGCVGAPPTNSPTPPKAPANLRVK